VIWTGQSQHFVEEARLEYATAANYATVSRLTRGAGFIEVFDVWNERDACIMYYGYLMRNGSWLSHVLWTTHLNELSIKEVVNYCVTCFVKWRPLSATDHAAQTCWWTKWWPLSVSQNTFQFLYLKACAEGQVHWLHSTAPRWTFFKVQRFPE
jgi:hypothetical protein